MKKLLEVLKNEAMKYKSRLVIIESQRKNIGNPQVLRNMSNAIRVRLFVIDYLQKKEHKIEDPEALRMKMVQKISSGKVLTDIENIGQYTQMIDEQIGNILVALHTDEETSSFSNEEIQSLIEEYLEENQMLKSKYSEQKIENELLIVSLHEMEEKEKNLQHQLNRLEKRLEKDTSEQQREKVKDLERTLQEEYKQKLDKQEARYESQLQKKTEEFARVHNENIRLKQSLKTQEENREKGESIEYETPPEKVQTTVPTLDIVLKDFVMQVHANIQKPVGMLIKEKAHKLLDEAEKDNQTRKLIWELIIGIAESNEKREQEKGFEGFGLKSLKELYKTKDIDAQTVFQEIYRFGMMLKENEG